MMRLISSSNRKWTSDKANAQTVSGLLIRLGSNRKWTPDKAEVEAGSGLMITRLSSSSSREGTLDS